MACPRSQLQTLTTIIIGATLNNSPVDDYKLTDVPGWLRFFVIFTIFIAFSLISLYFLRFSGGLSSSQETWGQFGDFVGGILNPLFALSALFALLHTIVLQSKELRDSAAQLRKSAVALEAQNTVLQKQTFENTFFQLLAQFNSVVLNMTLTFTSATIQSIPLGTYTGHECLEKLWIILANDYLPKERLNK